MQAATPLVLLTRPRRESRLAARVLAAAGIASLRMPLQATRRVPCSATLAADLAFAAGADVLVFVSRAAVAAALQLAPASVAGAPLRIAVGAATAAALQARGCAVVQAPGDAEDSEGVLALAALQAAAGKRIGIVAAPGGRQRMAEALAARGAQVRMLMLYRRRPLRPRPQALAALRAQAADVVLSASSALLLEALDRVLVSRRLEALRAQPLVVASARIGERARALGFPDVHIARGASAQALAEALAALNQPGRPARPA